MFAFKLRQHAYFTASFLAFSAMPVIAQDFGSFPSNQVSRAWQGFYAGAHVGYSFGNYEATIAPGPGLYSTSPNDVSYGLYGGYNVEWMSQFVAGAEADITFSNPEGSQLVGGAVIMSDANWTGSLRGRLGMTFEQFYFYGTAGIALGGVEFASVGGSSDAVKFGGAVGVGAEAQITSGIIARAEYLYTSFGSGNYALGPLTAVDGEFDNHTVRIGLGYHF